MIFRNSNHQIYERNKGKSKKSKVLLKKGHKDILMLYNGKEYVSVAQNLSKKKHILSH